MANDSRPMVALSPEQLQQLLAGVISEAQSKMNPFDRLKYEQAIHEQQRQEHFKALVAGEVAAAKARALTCSHSRWPQGHKNAGHPCPTGKGEYATGGQIIGSGANKLAALICLRGCGTTWIFRPSDDELAYFEEVGMLGQEPPAAERVLVYCSHCSKPVQKVTVEAHEATCSAKLPMSPMKKMTLPVLEAR